MPDRTFAAKEMANLLGVLAHPERIRIVQELRAGELDVNSIRKLLAVTHSRISQNLGLLRSHRIVSERRAGRHVFYRLTEPKIADWLLEGLEFLKREAAFNDNIRTAVSRAQASWAGASQAEPES